MNLITARALLEDARQQVLDNTVFRLLVILSGIPILATFLVGFREDHISFLWGFRTVEYKAILEGMNIPGNFENINEVFIQGLQSVAVNFFGGSVGVIFCIAATAFFTPRILEKGAADTLFAKPVSRLVILLSRYFSGILFIGMVGTVLVVGMYLGILITSGYNDPGFLWGVVTLMYLFSLLHAFSVFIAVMTRSSTAAILITVILFMISGGVHGGWMMTEYFKAQSAIETLRTEGTEDEEEDEGSHPIVVVLLGILDTLHYTLPKTGDADIITDKLRKAITESAPQIETSDGDLLVKRAPDGFVMKEGTEDQLEGDGVRWIAETSAGEADGWVGLRRYERPEIEEVKAGRTRKRRQSSRDASKALVEELEKRDDLEGEIETENRNEFGLHTLSVSWGSEGRHHERIFFHFDRWLYELDIDLAEDYLPEEDRHGWQRGFLQARNNIVLGQISGMDPGTWYTKTFSWTAPWKFNIFFSIGSSLAFAVLMLFFAWLKLRRIDF